MVVVIKRLNSMCVCGTKINNATTNITGSYKLRKKIVCNQNKVSLSSARLICLLYQVIEKKSFFPPLVNLAVIEILFMNVYDLFI